jgi:hypothetical protein
MGIVKFQVSVSVDGYLARPNQTLETPLGVGGEALHDWMVQLEVWRPPALPTDVRPGVRTPEASR